MPMQGMDVDAAQMVVQVIRSSRDEFAALVSRMTTTINGVKWDGPDQVAYLNEWQQQSQSLLTSITSFIDAMSSRLQANIGQQTDASSGLDGGFSGLALGYDAFSDVFRQPPTLPWNISFDGDGGVSAGASAD